MVKKREEEEEEGTFSIRAEWVKADAKGEDLAIGKDPRDIFGDDESGIWQLDTNLVNQ